jgi:hypothetical protein
MHTRYFLRLLLLALSFTPFGLPSIAQELDSLAWEPSGRVRAVARDGNLLYLGGAFEYVGPRTGGGAPVHAATGVLVEKPFPYLDGFVYASAPDGNGGWYVGGIFTVRGSTLKNMVHVRSDGRVDEAWRPRVEGTVFAMVLSGNTLFIGGNFALNADFSKSNLAAINVTTGTFTHWRPVANNTVRVMVASGNTVYLAGDFMQINTAGRKYLAAVDMTTGQPTAWGPYIAETSYSAATTVKALAVAGNRIFIGGSFRSIGGFHHVSLAAADLTTGAILNWDANLEYDYYNPIATALTVSGNTLYVAGIFRGVNTRSRYGLAAIHTETAEVLPWQPQASGGEVKCLAVRGKQLVVAGAMNYLNYKLRAGIGSINLSDGTLTDWAPALSVTGVQTLSQAGDEMYIGGTMNSIGGVVCWNLTAIDLRTGRPTSWRPNPSNNGPESIKSMAIADGKLYIGGVFKNIGPSFRHAAASFDLRTGTLTDWNPKISNAPAYDADVTHLGVANGQVFLAGTFTSLDGVPRTGLGVADAQTGQVKDWNLNLNGNGTVNALVTAGNTVYVGGAFTTIGGKSQPYLAAVDATTGQVTDWKPDPDNAVLSIAPAAGLVYAGGLFTRIGGLPRKNLAALGTATGKASPWDPNPNGEVRSLVLLGRNVYAAGTFTQIAGQPRKCLSAFSAAGGNLRAWNPDINYTDVPSMRPVAAMGASDYLYLYGQFDRVNGYKLFTRAGFSTRYAYNVIRGNIFADANADCVQNDGEGPLRNVVVMAEPGPYFGVSGPDGNYQIEVDTGTYTVKQVLPAGLGKSTLEQVCPADAKGHTVTFKNYAAPAEGRHFGNQPIQIAPFLVADLTVGNSRRCAPGSTVVRYGNGGGRAAEGVQVHVQYPPHVVLLGASMPYEVAPDKHYVFTVNTLEPGQFGTITLRDSVVCGNPAIRGTTQCSRAWITPANPQSPLPGWDQSDITLRAKCNGNGVVQMGIYNTGAGAMTDSSEFRVLLDALPAHRGTLKLAAGDSLIVGIAAEGRTVRLEADQRPGHPARRSASVATEGCGLNAQGKVSLGYVTQLPADDAEPEVDVECIIIIDSYDPNDKLVTPVGTTREFHTPAGAELSYTIRFQNTGTDVAYKVVVVDTLSTHLDLSTLRMGAVSHAYALSVTGKGQPVLTWTFDNIMLPDSGRNGPGSNGFIRFSIRPKAGVPAASRIENFADIFFDYNEPVRTPTVFNTISEAVTAPGGARTALLACLANAPAPAGADRVVCEQDTVNLSASQPATGTGSWRRVSGAGRVAEPHHPHGVVSGLAYGDNVFEWAVPANPCTDDSLRTRVTITRKNKPAAPVIKLQNGNVLHSDAVADVYRWYRDGNPVAGNAPHLVATQEGAYTLQLELGGCVSDGSAPFQFTVTAVEALADPGIRVEPNPGTGMFLLRIPAPLGRDVTISVVDAQGREVMRRAYTQYEDQVWNIASQRAGMFLLMIRTPQKLFIRKYLLVK